MGMRRYVSLTLIGFCLSLLYPVPSKAVHKGAGNLTCGSCHTMHSSQGGTNGPSMGGATGSFILLRTGGSSISSRAEIHKLCLQCHASNGTQADVVHAPQNVKAPKVYSSGTWSQNDPFNKIGAGGNFYSELDGSWNNIDGSATNPNKLGNGHSLGATNVTPPGGEADPPIAEFSCTNCHDPHGTNSDADTKTNVFRNLKVYATDAGNKGGVKFYTFDATAYLRMKSYVGGVNGSYFGGSETDNGSNVIWPVYRGTLIGDITSDVNNSNSYATGSDDCLNCSTGDNKITMSRWCAQCHDKWHEDITPTNRDLTVDRDWNRHAVNSMVPRKATAGCANTSGCHLSMLDRQNYDTTLITLGKGLPVTAANLGGVNELVYYLPYVSPGTCGSSPNWTCMDVNTPEGNVSGSNHKVFCLSCHFAHGGPYYDALRWNYTSAVSSGSQSGNGIASNVGCQLCHNR